jgi:hypothetical protein
MIAITIAGVSVPHLSVGVAGSLPAMILGIIVGLGCAQLALIARTTAGRATASIGLIAVALAPVIAYLAQETAERESGLEGSHAEPGLLGTLLTQAPLVILAILAARLVVAAIRTAVRAWTRPPTKPSPRRAGLLDAPACAGLFARPVPFVFSNGQRAPPLLPSLFRQAPRD